MNLLYDKHLEFCGDFKELKSKLKELSSENLLNGRIRVERIDRKLFKALSNISIGTAQRDSGGVVFEAISINIEVVKTEESKCIINIYSNFRPEVMLISLFAIIGCIISLFSGIDIIYFPVVVAGGMIVIGWFHLVLEYQVRLVKDYLVEELKLEEVRS